MFIYWNRFKRGLDGLGETFQELEDVELPVVVGQHDGRAADAVSGVDVSPGVDQKSNLQSEMVSIFFKYPKLCLLSLFCPKLHY